MALGLWANSHYFYFKKLTDYQKWQARPKLSGHASPKSQSKQGQNGLPPCFYIVPSGVVDQPVASGSVGDCLLLLPNGRKLDVLEVALGGALAHVKTDLYVPDTIPLAFTRVVIPLDDWARRNRISLPHVYDPYLTGSRSPYTYLDWRLPDRQSIHYERVSPGTGFVDAVYEHARSGSIFAGSRINWNGWGWDLALEDGTTYLSPEAYYARRPQQGSLVGIFDENGNEVRLTRERSGDLTQIQSPSGQWIQLSYSKGRICKATDNLGNVVEYDYDAEDRLVTVGYSSGQKDQYFYNSVNQITKIEDSSGRTLEAKYGSNGDVIELAVDGGSVYNLRSAVDRDARTAHIDVTDPKGEVTQVTIQMSADEAINSYTVATLGRQSKNDSQSKSSSAAKPSAPVADMPTDGFVKDGVYTNRFFQFSIQFPRAWMIVDTGAPMTQTGNGGVMAAGALQPPGNFVEAGYSLFWVGTVNKQTQDMHWIVIVAVKPTSSAHNTTPESFLKAEAEGLKLGSAEYQKKGQTQSLISVGDPTEVHISGRRLARLVETWKANNKAHRMVKVAMAERGYLILFMFTDPARNESDYEAAKEISSLRFFGRPN